ncbi:MAG: aspartyl protease [Cyanothece sp. SIO1E1]|nr:aspartyl protease [Cyanothece sp. SIO1E1]
MKHYSLKQQLSTLAVVTGIILIPKLAQAQADALCFFTNSDGQVIDLGSLCGSSNQGNASTTDTVFLSIPIKRRVSNVPVIEVTFNGKRTFDMAVDTGATGIIINPDMAAAIGLTPEGKIKVSTANGIIDIPTGRVSSVAAGGLVVNDLTVAVSPALDIGLLGHEFYQGYDITIKQDVVEFNRR